MVDRPLYRCARNSLIALVVLCSLAGCSDDNENFIATSENVVGRFTWESTLVSEDCADIDVLPTTDGTGRIQYNGFTLFLVTQAGPESSCQGWETPTLEENVLTSTMQDKLFLDQCFGTVTHDLTVEFVSEAQFTGTWTEEIETNCFSCTITQTFQGLKNPNASLSCS